MPSKCDIYHKFTVVTLSIASFLFDCILQELTKEIDPNSNGKIIPKKCDVTDETELLSIFKWIKDTIGHLDVFVNNAGVIKSDFLLGVPHSIYRFF